MAKPHPTQRTYNSLDAAYDALNAALFDGRLPACLITWQRHKGAYGYFAAARFAGMYALDLTDEIALNPATFRGQTQKAILSTLAHEMVHLWQYHIGTPPRRYYHDKQWAAKMIEIGLIPSHTGEPGGNQLGQHMDHYPVAGGPFDRASDEILAHGPVIHWGDADTDQEQRKKKRRSKTKYTCQACNLNAWAKHGANLWCGDCQEQMDEEPKED